MKRKAKRAKRAKGAGRSGVRRRVVRTGSAAGRGRLGEQAERFHRVFTELVRAYQFRDRESVVYRDLSVSQCYTLDTLAREGAMSMSRVADRLHLDLSTITRVVDHLVSRNLVVRLRDQKDRRVLRVRISRSGRSLHREIRSDLIREYEAVLSEVPPGSREAVISAITLVHAAFRGRKQHSCAQVEQGRKPSRAGTGTRPVRR